MNAIHFYKAKSVVISLAAIAAFTACKKDESASAEQGRPLTLNVTAAGFASDEPATRASESGASTVFTNDDRIGITVIKDGANILEDNIEYKYDQSGGVWTPATAGAEIHAHSGTITYLVYYPYSASMNGKKTAGEIAAAFTPKSDQSTYANYTASDLMTGTGAVTGITLNISLAHALSMVEIELPDASSAATLKINAATASICNIAGTAHPTYRRIVAPAAGITLSGGYSYAGQNITWEKTGVTIAAGQYTKVTVNNPLLNGVVSVAATPATASVIKGYSKQFSATVTVVGTVPDQTVTWSVSPTNGGSTINPTTGVLSVAAGETNPTLTVTATSNAEATKTGTATVTVLEATKTNVINYAFETATGGGATTADPKTITIPAMAWDSEVKSAIDANLSMSSYYSLDMSAITGVTTWGDYANMIGGDRPNDENNAMYNTLRSRIVALVLPNSVTEIVGGALRPEGQWGGGWGNLASVSGANVTKIGNDCLTNERRQGMLVYVDFPSLTEIGNFALAHTGIMSYNLPFVTKLGWGAFANCTTLTTLNLPEVTNVGSQAFTKCTALTTLNLSKLTSAGYEIFMNTGSATALTITFGATQHTLSGGNVDNWFNGTDNPTGGKTVIFNVPSGTETNYNTWISTMSQPGSGHNHFNPQSGTLSISVTTY